MCAFKMPLLRFSMNIPRGSALLQHKSGVFITFRNLSSGEVSTALRPFYFSVHPDLFGKHPNERTVNENSLKQLSSYLETIQQRRTARPTTIKFYLRSQQQTTDIGGFRSVTIRLSEYDVRNTVLSILKTCDLPTTYVDSITRRSQQSSRPAPDYSQTYQKATSYKRYEDIFNDSDDIYNSQVISRMIKKSKDDENLMTWLDKNTKDAAEKQAACQPVLEEIERLRQELAEDLNLRDVIWDCGWNVTHFRGCLQSFRALSRDHPEIMSVLKGRTLVFGNGTGVSWKGAILLCSSEVRHNWLDFLKNVWKQDAALLAIPPMQKAVSRVLRDIKVVHRKFQPNVMANNYSSQLRRLVTSLSDHQGRYGYPRTWPESLEKFELVVEPEAGPLMLSPTGQFIVPSSCPASLLVSFFSDHMAEAEQLLINYKTNKHIERELHKRCKEELGLQSLHKEDNVTPDLMITCCRRLLENKDNLSKKLKGRSVWITHYYSIMSDGQICIPWNWKFT